MQNRKQLEKDIALIGSFKGLAQAYEEISVTRMQKARGKVLSAREFLEELLKVFDDVRSSYSAQIEVLTMRKRGVIHLSTSVKNGKSVAILISSNSKLYGDIGKKVFRTFIADIKASNADIYIIGRVGKEMFDVSGVEKEYQYSEYPDVDSKGVSIDQLIGVFNKYENVKVYYGKFINVIRQDSVISNVTGRVSAGSKSYGRQVRFFFEPSLEEVLTFFENQIFGSLFRQTLHESELSHVASRITQMEYALENIETMQKKLEKKRKLVIKRADSAKRLQRLSGMRLWR